MHLLALTDDDDLRRTLDVMLHGYVIDHEYEADAAADLARRGDYDTILLGDSLADASDQMMLRALRRATIETPVLCILSAPKVLADTMACYDAGADDVVVRGISAQELDARIEALCRRARGIASPVLTIGPLELNLRAKQVFVSGRCVPLTNKEWRLLEALALARTRGPMSSGLLLDMLYSAAIDQPEIKIIDVFICKVRKKLRDAGAAGIIETVWGRGYRLADN